MGGDLGPFWGLGSGGKKAPWLGSLGHTQVCRKNILAMACVVCQGQMEAPSVPLESGSWS